MLLLATRSPGPLAPLCADRSLAELPVVGRSVLERALEAIAPLAPARVTIAAAGDVVRLRAFVCGGERWGLAATVLGARPDEPLARTAERLPARDGAELLVVPADRLYDMDLGAALAGLRDACARESRAVRCTATGLLRAPAGVGVADPARIELEGAAVLPIDSPRAYHAAACRVSRGECPRLPIAGRQRAVGLRQGYMTSVHPGSVRSGHAFVGNGCRVHRTCSLAGTVVLGNGVSIGRMTRVENAVVLADTVVGEHLHLRDAIVAGDTVVRVDTGAVLRVGDRFLLCERGAGLSREYLSGPTHRLLGAALSVACAPLALVAAAAVAFARRANPFVARRLVGNRRAGGTAREFTAWSLDLDVPVARRLPMLAAVASGDLRLFGVAPLSPEESAGREEGWQSVRDRVPAGLLGPTQLRLGLDAPLEERLLSDAVAAHGGTRPGEAARLALEALRCAINLDGRERRRAWAGVPRGS